MLASDICKQLAQLPGFIKLGFQGRLLLSRFFRQTFCYLKKVVEKGSYTKCPWTTSSVLLFMCDLQIYRTMAPYIHLVVSLDQILHFKTFRSEKV